MDSVLRALTIFGFLLVLMRFVGRRTLGEMTPFDFVLLLILGETTQQALLGDDFSVTNAMIVIATLLGADITLSLIKQRSRRLERLIDGVPILIVNDGAPIREALDNCRVDEEDILAAARLHQGLERMDQIRWAVLETNGEISVIPR